MGSMSIWHWVIVALVVMLLFGKGRISEMMGDLAKGIKSFKQGMSEDDVTTAPRQVTQAPPVQAQPLQPQPLQPMAAPVAQPAPVLSPEPTPHGTAPTDSSRP